MMLWKVEIKLTRYKSSTDGSFYIFPKKKKKEIK